MGLTPASTDRWAFTTKEPIGVVVAISAFNHPLNLIVHQVVPAIAVGCPVIVKPASATPLSCVDFVALVHEAGLPEPWCQTFIPESNDLAEQLATDPRVAFMSFIGSARVGWSLHHKLAPGTRSALEHGGVAPAIVDRSADLSRTIEPMVRVDTTTLDRFAYRPSASLSMPQSKPSSWSGSRRVFVRCASAILFDLRQRSGR